MNNNGIVSDILLAKTLYDNSAAYVCLILMTLDGLVILSMCLTENWAGIIAYIFLHILTVNWMFYVMMKKNTVIRQWLFVFGYFSTMLIVITVW